MKNDQKCLHFLTLKNKQTLSILKREIEVRDVTSSVRVQLNQTMNLPKKLFL